MRTSTWDRVYARRLARSHLDARAPYGRLVEVVRDTLGLHAQLMSGAALALSARVEGVTRETLPGLLWERRELVKGNTIRGTLHLHPPDDYALWKSAYEPRWRTEKWLQWQGLTLADAQYLQEAVLAVLDEPRTREEIGRAVGGRLGRRIAEDSWGHLLAPAADAFCHGPPRGRNVTFVRADTWLPGFRRRDRVEALRELVGRYLATYGPADRSELEHWFAARLPDEALEGHGPGELPEAKPRGVRLLWHYDVYVIGCHPREHLIPVRRERIFLRGAGPKPALLVDGRVAGTWTRERKTIAVEPFRRLTQAQLHELGREQERVAALL